jgi:hypothetical protein
MTCCLVGFEGPPPPADALVCYPGNGMPPAPQRAFHTTLGRVESLTAVHGRMHGTRGRPRQEVSDMLRGALVLAVAALDALVLDSITAAIPRLAKQGALGDRVTSIVKENPKAVLYCFAADDPSKALQEVVEEQLGKITFQRSAAIEDALRSYVLCESPWAGAAERLSDETTLWTPQDVQGKLDEYVARRNRIAHSGDLGDNGRATPIRLDYIARAVRVIRAVGDQISAEVAAITRSQRS